MTFSQSLQITRGLIVTFVALLSLPTVASAVCTVEREIAGEPALFVRHFSSNCTKPERTTQAVQAAEILQALKAGKGVSIRNAVVSGELLLTQLKAVPRASVSLPQSVLTDLAQSRVTEVRVIRGPFEIRDSVVDGILDTQLKPDMVEHRMLGDMVVIQGPVTFRGTTFAKDVDLSRTIFLGPVESAEAVFLGDALFLSCIFDKPVTFEKNAFFMHAVFAADTYFRRATFRGEVNFSDAAFKAKDDFAKVFYQQEPNFIRAKFATPRSSVGFENPVLLIVVGVALTFFLIAFILILKRG